MIFKVGYHLGPILFHPGSAPDPIWLKNTRVVKDLDYFLPVKFRQNLSIGCGEEVKNVRKCPPPFLFAVLKNSKKNSKNFISANFLQKSIS